MFDRRLLIIFIKNPVKGNVKTRLAKTMGEEKALQIYKSLLNHTQEITVELPCTKMVFYSDFVDENDNWKNEDYKKHLQHGINLGERMLNAFNLGFNKNFREILIIGSDCFELNKDIISKAFDALATSQFVIGPAKDGGYYLLGMKKIYKVIFENKIWSTASVLADTIQDFEKNNASYFLLSKLTDIDEEKDLIESNFKY